MIVCPVCEHAQAQGAECEVCGKRLLRGPAAIPAVAPVEGLEPTRHADVDVAEETVPELVPTGLGAADAPVEAAPGLESGRAAPVDVPDERVPGLEHAGEGIPGDVPTGVPAIVTCRYCRTPAPPGERVCGRCGMRLPVFEERVPEEELPVRRCSCGAVVTSSLCPSCGSRVA